jgi:hypothetical protein
MENFPGNSNSAAKAEPQGKEEKRVLKVVTNNVVRKEKTRTQRFMSTFLTNPDGSSIFGYVVREILVPAAQEMIVNAFHETIERAIYGESRSPARRAASRPTFTSGPTNYTRYSTQRAPETRPPMNRRARASHNFDEIILATRAEAEEVLKQMSDLVDRYGTCSVSDLYEMLGLDSSYTDEKYGWTDLRSSGVDYTRSGYLLNLPRPEPID